MSDDELLAAVRRSSESKTRDVSPFGLWVLAGSWCGDHSTGGFATPPTPEESQP